MFDYQKCVGTRIGKGKIVGFDQHGTIIVEPEDGGDTVPCYCIRNGKDALPVYNKDDMVAFTTAEDGRDGFIFGRIEAYIPCTDEQSVAPPSVQLPIDFDKKRKSLTLQGKTITLDADKEATIVCGKSSIHLRKDGRVVIRGARILSRSSGTNKIRGASVMIN
jgi:hypothetical protein